MTRHSKKCQVRKSQEASERFKLLEKEPKLKAKSLLESIKYKSEQNFGVLYLIDDQESNMMFSFDKNGICVDARPLAKDEKQLKMKTLKNGTDE